MGKALPGTELKIADDGEILVRGAIVFKGYLNQPELTAETLTEDGWIHTGDLGRLDQDGFLWITGRKKEIIITAGGKNVTPANIENLLKDHPLIGYKLIEEFTFLKQAALVVLCHHEHFDGTGYPYGLAGEEIPLEARIFSLADTVDAITSDRPYRLGQSFDKARREIENHSGTQFDPQLVDAFLRIPEERWLQAKLENLRNLRTPSVH